MANCKLCEKSCADPSIEGNLLIYSCFCCGKYAISGNTFGNGNSNRVNFLFANNRSKIIENLHNIRGYLKENEIFTISEENFNYLVNLKNLKVTEKIKRLLLFLSKRIDLGDEFTIDYGDQFYPKLKIPFKIFEDNLSTVIYGKNAHQVRAIMEDLVRCRYIEVQDSGPYKKFTTKGFEYIESLENSVSDMGFVAMWFGQYSIFLMSDLKDNEPLKDHSLYLQSKNDGQCIYYKGKGLNSKIFDGLINKEDIDDDSFAPLMLAINDKKPDNISNEVKRKLLTITSKNGYSISMSDVWDKSLVEAINGSGYLPKRIDMHDHTNVILDEIEGLIRQSRFIIVDLTGHRGGVYFEAGYAKALQKTIIYTCEKSDFHNRHFDVQHFNCLEWDKNNLPEFKKNLQNKIENILGKGKFYKEVS